MMEMRRLVAAAVLLAIGTVCAAQLSGQNRRLFSRLASEPIGDLSSEWSGARTQSPEAAAASDDGHEVTSVTPAAAGDLRCPVQCQCFELSVDCSGQQLTELPHNLPNYTQVLDLHNNRLESLPRSALSQMPHLRAIIVSTNERLAVLTRQTFADNGRLHEIDLSSCGLEAIPMLDLPPSVRVVKLSGNNIRQLDRTALARYRHVHELDLSHNRLSRLPPQPFPAGAQTRTLKLQSNRITSLDLDQFHTLQQLQVLKLAKNRISRLIKDAFRGLTQLRELDLNRNRLMVIDSLVFSGLDSLQVLKLKRNNIQRLNDGAFYHLPNMTQLFLDHNAIGNITKGWLFGVGPLRQLGLSHNRLGLMQRGCWSYCERLARLDLGHNQLDAVDARTFASLPRLTELVLDHNKIALIEQGAFSGSPRLRVLELNYNKISSTIEDRSGAFSGLSQLERLGLRHNRIMSVSPQSFAGAPALQQIDLSENELTTLHEASFSGLPQLRRLLIDSGSLLCDCALRWLPAWLRRAGHADTVTARCHHPQPLHGLLLLDVPAERLACSDSPKPAIRLQPRAGKALKGDNLTISCEAESSANDTMQFAWRKDSLAMEAGGRVAVRGWAHADGRPGLVMRSELRLQNLTDADAGQYQCVVSNKYGVSYSDKASIAIHVFPVFLLRPEDLQLRAGSTAKLECKAGGQPAPTVLWAKDGGSDFPAAQERRMHMLPSEDVFYIVRVKAADQGTYTCTARNEAGEIHANATLSVLEVPSFVRPMADREVAAGDTAVLDCMAAGSPAPRLTWRKDGAPLQATERHFYTARHQLLIIVQTRPEDAGTYQCQLSNVLGEERGTTTLSVVTSSSFGMDDDSTYAIIIIAVVSGVVVTSLVWVIIIYQARKRSLRQLRARAAAAAAAGEASLSPPPPRTVTVYSAAAAASGGLLERRPSSVHLYAGDDGSEHSSGKDSGQGGHEEAADLAGGPLLVAVAAESDDEGVGGTPLLERRRRRVLTTFQGGPPPAPSAAARESLQTVVPRHLYTDRRLAQLADGALVTARARGAPTDL